MRRRFAAARIKSSQHRLGVLSRLRIHSSLGRQIHRRALILIAALTCRKSAYGHIRFASILFASAFTSSIKFVRLGTVCDLLFGCRCEPCGAIKFIQNIRKALFVKAQKFQYKFLY